MRRRDAQRGTYTSQYNDHVAVVVDDQRGEIVIGDAFRERNLARHRIREAQPEEFRGVGSLEERRRFSDGAMPLFIGSLGCRGRASNPHAPRGTQDFKPP